MRRAKTNSWNWAWAALLMMSLMRGSAVQAGTNSQTAIDREMKEAQSRLHPGMGTRDYSPPPPYFGTNPSFSDIKAKLIAAGQKYHIPPHVLYGIAFQESGWNQFRSDGRTVYHQEPDGRNGVGIMQMTISPSASDYSRLCTDIDYNIDRGASLLVDKWNQTPTIGDGIGQAGREKLENWYYAIWAYNGFVCPNPYPETVMAHIANGRALWTPVTITNPNISSCPPGRIQNTPSPVHVDANYDGVIDGSGRQTAGAITRDEVIQRAKQWVNDAPAYNQGAYHLSYRTDCSGYVSWAWNTGTNYWTGNLATICTRINKDDLQPGDILLHHTANGGDLNHVTIFSSWANSQRTSYWGFEFSAYWGVPKYHAITYAYWAGYDAGNYVPYRYNGITDNSSSITVGQGSAFQQQFVDCYNRTEGIQGANWVGKPLGLVHDFSWPGGGAGLIQDFGNGRGGQGAILLKNGAGKAVHVQGEYWTRFLALLNTSLDLGWPRDDRRDVSAPQHNTLGSGQSFEHADLYSRAPNNDLRQVRGDLRLKFNQMGATGSVLGFPLSDPFTVDASPSGLAGDVQQFQGGNLMASGKGIWTVRGAIKNRYLQADYQRGLLGWPLADEKDIGPSPQGTRGQVQPFESGAIYASTLGAFLVTGNIIRQFESQGWELGPLGFPISDPYNGARGKQQDFEGGTLYENPAAPTNAPPVNGSTTPASAIDAPATPRNFTATYSDNDGASDITLAALRVGGTAANSANSLLCLYNATTNKLSIYNDAATALVGSVTPGTATVLSNSQGSLNCGAVTTSKSGNTLTVNWNVSATGAFAGTRQTTFLFVRDADGLFDPYKAKGTWTINGNARPSTVGVTPASVSTFVGVEQFFTTTFSDPNGYKNLQFVTLRLGGSGTNSAGAMVCVYNVQNNKLYLFDDAGNYVPQADFPGRATVLNNSQGSLDCARTTVTGSGNTLTVKWSVKAKAAFAGSRAIALLCADRANLRDGYDLDGIWTITGAGGAPATSSGLSTASASSDGIVLKFDRALDASSAANRDNYSLRINGAEVGASVEVATSSVTLRPEMALHAGDNIEVAWRNVLDAKGNSLRGQTNLTAR